jgi:hypothetical protein
VRLVGPGTGPGQLALTRQLDLLVYLAVRIAACEQTDEHADASVAELEVRADLWGETASKYLVSLTAARLADDLNKLGLVPPERPIRVKGGQVSLDEAGCLVDVLAFQRSVADARKAGGPDGLAAAEAAVAAYGGPLLDGLAPSLEDENPDDSDETTGAIANARGAGPTGRGGRPTREPLLGWAQERPALRTADRLEAQHRLALRLLADRLWQAGRCDEALARAWDALRVGTSVPSDDAEHLGVRVLEAAARHDGARLDAEYQALERHLDRHGPGLPEHVQQRYAALRLAPGTDQAGRSVSGDGSRSRPVARGGVQGTQAAAETN